ncbi:metal ABC transporter ATP-binding protein [Virgibacillus proomii]|uniref:metal ABC transporter ATP-binding protein n=1 Tax=Virgibacillus proomii TaxID=84407 RepID=UPI001C108F64|nr:metal ABC transporter ATP-binding protein [Virgibacillus proomii]MBU5267280.1 metal ABC transporter ATP-binding protein [Virgibacillus proomii]
MKEKIVSIENVSFTYENKKVLENIYFTIPKGSFVGLIGPNGGGKTTLIKLILGLEKPDTGSIKLFGEPMNRFSAWNKIGYVSQKANTFNKGFPATVFEVVSMGLTAKIGYLKFFTRKHKEKIHQALQQVDMEAYVYENIGNLSGGQQQRIFIARSLVSDPELLILDEPTVGVDHKNVQRFYDLLDQLNLKQGITMLMVTHDTGTITEQATHIACLNKTLYFHGKRAEYKSLTEKDLSQLYGHQVNIVKHDH